MIRKTYGLGVAMKGGFKWMEGDRTSLRVIPLYHPELKHLLNPLELKSPPGV
jgi:hypothetical protein